MDIEFYQFRQSFSQHLRYQKLHFFALLAGLALAAVWCTANEDLSELLLDTEPILNWNLTPVLTVFCQLSNYQNDNIELLKVDSVNVTWIFRLGVNAGIHRYNLSLVKLIWTPIVV